MFVRKQRSDPEINATEMIMRISAAPAAVGERPRAQASGLVATVKSWWIAYLTRRVERVAIMQLHAMSEWELKDIGLSRSQIERAVKGEFNHWPIIRHD